jgi:hypothetical protein
VKGALVAAWSAEAMEHFPAGLPRPLVRPAMTAAGHR